MNDLEHPKSPEPPATTSHADPTGPKSPGQILIYRDASLNLQVRLDGRTVWLTQRQLAELYQTTVPNINQHLGAIYDEGELPAQATIKRYLIVQTEGTRQVRRKVEHYNLDVILAVGYRVRSARGTQFRQWATARLRELLVKGFVLDDERIKAGQTIAQEYFDESMYLDYAEDQVRRHQPMHMSQWAARLDAFLGFNERNILTHAGTISHELAEEHALKQFDSFDRRRLEREAPESAGDFDRAVEQARRLEARRRAKALPPGAARPPRRRKGRKQD